VSLMCHSGIPSMLTCLTYSYFQTQERKTTVTPSTPSPSLQTVGASPHFLTIASPLNLRRPCPCSKREAVWVRGSQLTHAHLQSGTLAGHCVALAFVTLPCRVALPSLCHVVLVASLCHASLTFIAPPSCSALPQCTMMIEFFAHFRVLLLTLPTAGLFCLRLINPLAIANYCFPS
jgi:hypothetical protein